MPPRRPTIRHGCPSRGRRGCPAGAATSPRRSRSTARAEPAARPSSLSRAPCGGERPSGSSSRTGSCGRSVPQRRTSAFIRWSKLPAFGGSSTSTTARSTVPIREASTLRSSCAEPDASPGPGAEPRPPRASTATRRRGSDAASPSAARTAATPRAGTSGVRARFASAKPRQRAPTSACGRRTVTSRDHQSLQLRHVRRPDPGHALRARRPSGRRRAAAGSRGSSARSPVRFPAGSRAARASPSSGRAARTATSRPREEPPRRRRPRRVPGRRLCSPSATGAARLTASSCALARRPAGGRDRVVDPRALAQPVEARTPHRTGDVDHDELRRCRSAASRQAARESRQVPRSRCRRGAGSRGRARRPRPRRPRRAGGATAPGSGRPCRPS